MTTRSFRPLKKSYETKDYHYVTCVRYTYMYTPTYFPVGLIALYGYTYFFPISKHTYEAGQNREHSSTIPEFFENFTKFFQISFKTLVSYTENMDVFHGFEIRTRCLGTAYMLIS